MSKVAMNIFGKAIRETGQALDRLGCTIAGKESFKETFSRHRSIMPLFDEAPEIAADAFVAPSATVVGNVKVEQHASVWYSAVVRGDRGVVSIGARSNIQDRAVLEAGVTIGNRVTVGHGALLEGCSVGDGALVGQGAIMQEGSTLGAGSIVAAGAVVLPETVIPSGQMWAGNPAVFKKNVSPPDMKPHEDVVDKYVDLAKAHMSS